MVMQWKIAWLICLGVPGCTYAPRVVHLHPISMLGTTDPGKSCVEIGSFLDAREEKSRIGVARNGFHMVTGFAKTYDDVAGWIQSQLVITFGSPDREECSNVPRYQLSGSLLKSFVDEYGDLNGEITAQLQLTKGSEVISHMAVTGIHTQTSWAASDGEFTDVIYQTLQDFSQKAIMKVHADIAVAAHDDTSEHVVGAR